MAFVGGDRTSGGVGNRRLRVGVEGIDEVDDDCEGFRSSDGLSVVITSSVGTLVTTYENKH